MRRIIGAVFQSLDGVMQAPGGPSEDRSGGFRHGGWLAGLGDDPAVDETIGGLFTPPYALLLGRRTYDIFAGHWPYVEGEAAEFAAALTAARKYVLTHSDAPLDWANSHRLPDLDALAALKAEDGPDLLIQGSSTLYPALLERGLLDRLTVMTFPVVLGAGKRLFDDATPARTLTLVNHRVSAAGAVISTYAPAGDVAIATFDTPAPSDRERERQRRIEEGRW